MDQYEPLAKLGEGSFGQVILAKHKFSGAKVAIKVINKENTAKMFSGQMGQTGEVQIMQECNSDTSYILEMIESFEDAEAIYVVTKYMPAGDLLNYLVKQPT